MYGKEGKRVETAQEEKLCLLCSALLRSVLFCSTHLASIVVGGHVDIDSLSLFFFFLSWFGSTTGFELNGTDRRKTEQINNTPPPFLCEKLSILPPT